VSRDASIILAFGDGDFLFRLGWGEIAKIQEACGCGPFVLHDRLRDGSCRLEDISEVIRWGLIGGGLSPVEATQKLKLFVQDRPPAETRLTAYAVMAAGCFGAPEEQIEKKSEAPSREQNSATFPMEESGSEHSTH
jgi:tail tube GTA-gp10-like protein